MERACRSGASRRTSEMRLLQEDLPSSSNLRRVYRSACACARALRRSLLGTPRQTRRNLTFSLDSLVYSKGLEKRRGFHFTAGCQDTKHVKGRRILGGGMHSAGMLLMFICQKQLMWSQWCLVQSERRSFSFERRPSQLSSY